MQRFKLFFLVAAFFLFSASWLLPNHYYPWVSAYQEFSAFLGLLSLVLVLLCSGAGAGAVLVPRVFVFFVFVACIPVVQFLLDVVVFFENALISFSYIFGFLLMLVLGRSRVSVEVILAFAWALLLAGVVSVGIALAQWQLINDSIWFVDMAVGGRPFANLAQPNNLATLLLLSSVSVFYLSYRGLLGRLVTVLLLVFLMFGLALTQSRGGFAFVLSLYGLYFLFLRKAVSSFPLREVSMVFCLYVFFFLLVPVLSAAMLLSGEGIAERLLAGGRIAIWHQLASALFIPHSWLGYGWGQVSHAQVAAAGAGVVGAVVTEYAHNAVLDLLLWNGWILGGGIVAVLAYFSWRLVTALQGVNAVFGAVFSLVIISHSLLELPHAYGFFLLPLGFFLGFASSHMALREWSVPWPGSVLFVLSGAVLWGWVFYEYRILEEDYRLMRFESLNIGTLRAEKKAPDVVLLSGIREFIRFARTPPREGMTQSELRWMQDVAYEPPFLPSLIRYAVSLGLNGQENLAAEQILLIKKLHGPSGYNVTVSYIRGLSLSNPALRAVLEAVGEG